MADVFRASYQMSVPRNASLFTKNGVTIARFRLAKSGRQVEGRIMANGKVSIRTELYYGYVRKNGKSRRVALGVTDQRAARQLLVKLQLHADHRKAGMLDPCAEHRDTPLLAHLQAYLEHKRASGHGARNVEQARVLNTRLCKACRFRTMDDFDQSALDSYLAGIVASGRTFRTRNHSLIMLKAFVRWMLKTGRIERDPFPMATRLNPDADPRRKIRRALSVEEFAALLRVTDGGPRVQGIAPHERQLIYLVAATTGLRRAEIANLAPRDFHLDAPTPFLALNAHHTKAKRDTVLPLHPLVVDKLRPYLASHHDGPLFHLRTETGYPRDSSLMIRTDCETAGVEPVDFHSLRATFITNLSRSCSDFSLVVDLARHSDPKLTARVYDKVQLGDKAKAVGRLLQFKE